MQKEIDKTHVLYYRNTERDLVGFWVGPHRLLRRLRDEISNIDPGNYLAIHNIPVVTELNLDSEISDAIFNIVNSKNQKED